MSKSQKIKVKCQSNKIEKIKYHKVTRSKSQTIKKLKAKKWKVKNTKDQKLKCLLSFDL